MSEALRRTVGRPPHYEAVYQKALDLEDGGTVQIKAPKGKDLAAWRTVISVGLRSWCKRRGLERQFRVHAGNRAIWITRVG